MLPTERHTRSALIHAIEEMAVADGILCASELRALEAARRVLGDPRQDGDRAAAALAEDDRMLVFTAAAWMMLADGVRTSGESRYLAALGLELGLDPQTARFLLAHATWVSAESEADEDEDLDRELRWLLAEGQRRIRAVRQQRGQPRRSAL